MAYNNNHKIVLQTIIHEGALKEDRGKQLVTELFGNVDTVQVINQISAKLQPLNMTIKYINCEVTGQLYWVFASTIQDTTTRFQSEYSEAQLTLLRNIYSEIVTSGNGYVSSTWCLNLCSSLNIKLSKDKAQQFLLDIVEKKWLFCKDGRYYIGVRSIAELVHYFKDTQEDKLYTCTLCKEILFYGEKCEQCNAMTHIHCLTSYTRGHSNSGCPSCNVNISRLNYSDDSNSSTSDVEVEVSRNKKSISRQKKRLKKKH